MIIELLKNPTNLSLKELLETKKEAFVYGSILYLILDGFIYNTNNGMTYFDSDIMFCIDYFCYIKIIVTEKNNA